MNYETAYFSIKERTMLRQALSVHTSIAKEVAMFDHLHTDVDYYCTLRRSISNRDLQKLMIDFRIYHWQLEAYYRKMMHVVKKHSEIAYKINSDMRKAMINLTS